MQNGSIEGSGAVYVQTNEPDNHVIPFAARLGRRARRERVVTRPAARATGSPHLTSQGSVVLTEDGRHLLVANAASDDVSDLRRGEDGLGAAQTVATGPAPKSIAEHDGVVYVLNTGAPSVTGFRIADGGLVADRRLGARRWR